MRVLNSLMLIALVAFSLGIAASLPGQTYPAQIDCPIVQMSAKLDPGAKTIAGHYILTWWNHTDDPIPDRYFHLYLNAFKDLDSTFMREAAISRDHDALKEWLSIPGKEKWGWVDIDKIQIVNGADLTLPVTHAHPDENNKEDQTVVRIPLPQAGSPQS